MSKSQQEASRSDGPGHLFITRGDVTNIQCDAWLLPTDRARKVEPGWLKGVTWLKECLEALGAQGDEATPSCVGLDDLSVQAGGGLGRRTPYLTDVVHERGAGAEQPADGVRTFVHAATFALADPVGSSSRETDHAKTQRERPLLAVPLVGTGKGGWGRKKGEATEKLVRQLLELVTSPGSADIVLVLGKEEAFAAAQLARRRCVRNGDVGIASGLPERTLEQIEQLASRVRSGKLVVFMGAGLGMSSGLPSWTELLGLLSKEVNPQLPAGAEEGMPPLDRAWLVEERLRTDPDSRHGSLGSLVKETLPEDAAPSLNHYLIASLPVDELVTTNYDDLFEQASNAVLARHDGTKKIKEITDEPPGDGRWILKLHGSVKKPEDIVLSRNDYLDYSSRRAALAGVVQAVLLTRHMLFVGFSMSDDNFLKIAHDVRQAIGERQGDEAAVGTALAINIRPYMQELWSGFINLVDMGEDELGARELEIFLDVLLSESDASISYLYNPTFEGLLNDQDRVVRDSLETAAKLIQEAGAWGNPAGSMFEELLEGLGRKPSSSPREPASPDTLS